MQFIISYCFVFQPVKLSLSFFRDKDLVEDADYTTAKDSINSNDIAPSAVAPVSNTNDVAPSAAAPVQLTDKVDSTGENMSSLLHPQDTTTELEDANTPDPKKSKLLANAADTASPSTRVKLNKTGGGRKAK